MIHTPPYAPHTPSNDPTPHDPPIARQPPAQPHHDTKREITMTHTNNPAVQPGQIWADNDPRSTGRHIRVLTVDETHADVEQHLPRRHSPAKPSRTTRIRLDRFRPTSTGYRLVRNADGTPVEGQATR